MEHTFLQLVARDLYAKVGNNLAHTAVIFPNKRAALFFSEHLAAQSDGPMWSPSYTGIQELFLQLSPLRVADPIELVCLLHRVYREQTGSDEPLDDFYHWGELLIADFDDVDKNLAPARLLFSNLQDLKLMDSHEFLSEEQEKAISRFFSHFSAEKNTELKRKFLAVWNCLDAIYHTFRERLRERGAAYEGMVYRDALEHIGTARLPYDRIVFVGFNVLNRVETALMQHLKEAGKALFYWDYDASYVRLPQDGRLPFAHEAGLFIERNMERFPNELPPELFHNMSRPKTIRYMAAPTENAQARYIPQWHRGLPPGAADRENAVVLCDESLLQAVLHSMPAGVESVNITMGFPLQQTPVCGLVNALMSLQLNGYDPAQGRYRVEAVNAVLTHPYVRRLSPEAARVERALKRNNTFLPLPSELQADTVLEQLFTPCPADDNAALCRYLMAVIGKTAGLYAHSREDAPQPKSDGIYDQLYRESIFQAYTLVNRLCSLIESGTLQVRPNTLRRLLGRLTAARAIPFHGEPAAGLQVMGLLETRNLDFKNLLLLSVNEGKLPKSESGASFIPHNLRQAFGLTTIEHQNSVYAYYYYRLLQRAATVTLMYNNASDGMGSGEMSRFMMQGLVEGGQPVELFSAEAAQKPQEPRRMVVRKTPAVMERLESLYNARLNPGSYLSASALNTYMSCPLSFYFKYVARVRLPDETGGSIDAAMFGSIFHYAAELLYADLTERNNVVQAADIAQLLKEPHRLEAYIDRAFCHEFFHNDERPQYSGTQRVIRHVLVRYLTKLAAIDRQRAPFTYVASEQKALETVEVATGGGAVMGVNIGGRIDRMDSKDGVLRVVDYKTGSKKDTPKVKDMESVFCKGEGHDGQIFQAFLYASIVSGRHPGTAVCPYLLYIHSAAGNAAPSYIKMGKEDVADFTPHLPSFRAGLQELLRELFGAETPFAAPPGVRCDYCDYKALCHKRVDSKD